MSTAAWLQEQGLGQYASAFEDNDVDLETLAALTEADLLAIGVNSVGHRRKLLRAIARLSHEAPRPAAAKPSAAEHRQITVLYCHMPSAGDPSAQQDPEEYRDVIRAFHQRCTRAVAEFDGWVANFMGDCVLAYFGWPRAHEDDAERAVRTGLALVSVSPSELLRPLRVGIGTGPVVVGDRIQDGPAQEQSAIGVTPNLAARVLELADPGQVLIDELTQRLLGLRFAVQPLGSRKFKGIARPVSVYAIRGEQVTDRFEAHQGRELPPMVGRERELAVLMERWAQARGGEGSAVLITGDAGIGKSRLARAVIDACAAQPHWLVRWQCSSYRTGSALWPVIQRLSRTAGLHAEDSSDKALDKLEATLDHLDAPRGDAEASALYATLLGLNGAQRYGPLEMTPLMLRERTLELLAERLFEMAAHRPLLLVVEDAHWIDPTTRELVDRCLERIDQARMLMLVTSRAEPQPALDAYACVTRLSLNRLNRASAQAIVERLAGHALPTATLAAIMAQTDGVPLFLEEVSKAVRETGEMTIPASLQGTLMARLDRLPDAMDVAQVAACIGREFGQALLLAVCDRPEAALAALEKLADAELILRVGERANPRFAFRHALVQEAAYESLLRSRRKAIHARILDVLVRANSPTEPEILAYHAQGAQLVDAAIGYWTRAGHASFAKSAFVEAVGHARKGLELIDAQTDGGDRGNQELELQALLGHALRPAAGMGAGETRQAFERAYELLRVHPRTPSYRIGVTYGLWCVEVNGGKFERALHLASQLLADSRADETTQCAAHRAIATAQMFLGNFSAACEHFELALQLVPAVRRSELAVLQGDPEAAVLFCLAWTRQLQGFAVQARTLKERGMAIIRKGVQPEHHTVYSHCHCAMQAICARDIASASADVHALEELSIKHHMAVQGTINCFRGWLAAASRQSPEDALTAYETGLRQLAAGESSLFVPFFMAAQAQELSNLGRLPQAWQAIEHGVAACEQNSHGWCDAELWRVRGEVLLRHPRSHHAEALRSFERALELARARQARLWELRAAVSLARLWAAHGERARARDLLAPVCEWFGEDAQTVDLAEARELLVDLGQVRVGTS